jgi:hypothetical protein
MHVHLNCPPQQRDSRRWVWCLLVVSHRGRVGHAYLSSKAPQRNSSANDSF